MIILSIETSCDETAVSIVEASGDLKEPRFNVLGNSLFSQIEIHKEYGGVFPMLAKREHAKNLSPLLLKSLTEASMFREANISYIDKIWDEIEQKLSKETGLCEDLKKTFGNVLKPNVDVISVTSGPGLEPALWVGISFAEALGKLWNLPVMGVNHMEGHMASALFKENNSPKEEKFPQTKFPALALLISGGHTELVEISDWGKYKILGQTRDDAVGEAFDKVARMLGLPYPGGPQISNLAEIARQQNIPREVTLPRPMIHSNDLDFSFSGLKTSVLYFIRDHGELDEKTKMDIAREFEDAVVEVLLKKTKQALDDIGARALVIAGGVIANKKIRETFLSLEKEYSGLVVKIPSHNLSTDNALMIAFATYINTTLYPELLSNPKKIIALGNMKF